MTHDITSPQAARIMNEASQWVLRLKEDPLSEQELMAWLHWCDSDERHRKAFEEAQRFWLGVGELAQEPESTARLQALRTHGPVSACTAPGQGRRHRWTFALAASVAIMTIGVFGSQLLLRQPKTLVADSSSSVSHETLPDGSTVELAARSAVEVRYTEQQRLLELRPGGEAYFSVQRNPARPFIVSVGEHRVRAVGTAFNVRSSGDRVIVTVDEGTVEVYRASDPQPKGMVADSRRVSAGNEALWVNATTPALVTAVDPARALAWREGRLEYIDEPLADVLADVSRYSQRRVVLESATIDDLAFTGTVFAAAVDEWLRALPGEFPVDLVPEGEAELKLVRRKP